LAENKQNVIYFLSISPAAWDQRLESKANQVTITHLLPHPSLLMKTSQ